MKRLRNSIRRAWQWTAGGIQFEYNSVANHWRFRRAKNKADKLHKRTGKRHHVIPAGNGLIVVNRESIKAYNRSVPKAARIDFMSLNSLAYYSTPLRPLTSSK